MHPHSPQKSFHWPKHQDTSFVPFNEILCILEPLQCTSGSGRIYNLKGEDFVKIAWHKKIIFSHSTSSLALM